MDKLFVRGFITIVAFFITFCGVAVVSSECRTVRGATDNTILEHQARIIELENTNRALTERLEQYDKLVERTVQRLEVVRERAASIGDAAERIDYLFTEYERTVQQLIHELRPNGGTIGKGTENHKDVVNYLANLDRFEGFADYCRLYMADYQ